MKYVENIVNTARIFENTKKTKALEEYMEYMGFDLSKIEIAKDKFNEAYYGQYNDKEDFAEQLIDDMGILSEMPENLRGYFDYEAFTRDLFINGFFMTENGYVFRRI